MTQAEELTAEDVRGFGSVKRRFFKDFESKIKIEVRRRRSVDSVPPTLPPRHETPPLLPRSPPSSVEIVDKLLRQLSADDFPHIPSELMTSAL